MLEFYHPEFGVKTAPEELNSFSITDQSRDGADSGHSFEGVVFFGKKSAPLLGLDGLWAGGNSQLE